MANKCKFCFTKTKENLSQCPICKIMFNKTKKELTREEIGTWHAARNLYIVATLLVIGGVFNTVHSLIIMSDPRNSPILGLVLLALAICTMVIGFGLHKYKQWCYIGSIILLSAITLLNLLALHPTAIISGIFLYIVASKKSKKLLYKEI